MRQFNGDRAGAAIKTIRQTGAMRPDYEIGFSEYLHLFCKRQLLGDDDLKA